MACKRLIALILLFIAVSQAAAMKRPGDEIVKSGDNKRFKQETSWAIVSKGTPLHDALSEKSFFNFWLAVTVGADPDEMDSKGVAILWNAMTSEEFNDEEKKQCFLLLICHGVDVNVEIPVRRNTVLHHAVANGNIRLVTDLMYAKANVNAQDYHGHTPFHYLGGIKGKPRNVFNQLSVARILIEHGVDPNIQNIYGNTPLHYVATNKWVSRFLILIGADTEFTNNNGEMPYDYAKKDGYINKDLENRDSVKQVIMPPLFKQVGNLHSFVLNRQVTGKQMNNLRLVKPS